MAVSAIMPALNEAGSIGAVLRELHSTPVDEIVVVDGGSTDGTRDIARERGARVVSAQPGYGRACATGAAAATGEVLVFLDADGADAPADLPHLVAPILSGDADLVLGSRLRGRMEPGAMPWHQRMGNRLAGGMVRILYTARITDLAPYRAIRRDILQSLDMREMTYGWPTEMLVKALRCGYRVREIPVKYRARRAGRSKISGTVRGTVLAAYFIIGTTLRYATAPVRAGRAEHCPRPETS